MIKGNNHHTTLGAEWAVPAQFGASGELGHERRITDIELGTPRTLRTFVLFGDIGNG
jgi:hypothetical protein